MKTLIYANDREGYYCTIIYAILEDGKETDLELKAPAKEGYDMVSYDIRQTFSHEYTCNLNGYTINDASEEFLRRIPEEIVSFYKYLSKRVDIPDYLRPEDTVRERELTKKYGTFEMKCYSYGFGELLEVNGIDETIILRKCL